MKSLNDKSDRKTQPIHFYRQMVEAEELARVDRPIKIKHGRKKIIVQPTNPFYRVIKWYGEYETL